MNATLHYIFDPLCGWCYGAEPLAKAADASGINVALHGGGLWPEPTKLPDDMRNYIHQADGRLAELTGQPLGDDYRNGLLFDPDLVLDSKPTIAAVLAAEKLAHKGLAMLEAIQHAHYEHGKHVVRPEVLSDIAAGLGFQADEFSAAVAQIDADAHISETRVLMQQVQAQGFPTFVLEVNGRGYGVDHNRFHRNTAGFVQWLQSTIEDRAAAAQGAAQ